MATIQAPDLAVNQAAAIEHSSVAPQADSAMRSRTAPVYQFVQQFQSNNGASVALSTSGPTQSIWNLPGDVVWNFGQSFASFDLNLPAPADTYAIDIQTDVVPIDSIQIQTSGGTLLGNLNNVQAYCKVVQSLTQPINDYLTEGSVYAGKTVAESFYSQNSTCQPCNSLVTTAAANVPTSAYWYSLQASTTTPVMSAAALNAEDGIDRPYMAKQRSVRTTTAAVATTSGAAVMRFNIPFSAFVGTLLAVDKDILLGQNFQIVINWSATNRYTSICVAASNTLPATYTGAATMTSVYLWMAKEINGDIVSSLRHQVYSSGQDILIPYTTCGKGSTSAAGQYSLNQNLVAGMGLALKRVLNVPVRTNDYNQLANCNDNVNAHMYDQVQTFLDANPIQQKVINCGTAIEDFWYMKNFLNNTPAGLSAREFQIGSFWLDNFSDSAASGADIPVDDCRDSGLRIDAISKNYVATFNVKSAGMILYQYITFVRKLSIRPTGLSWGA